MTDRPLFAYELARRLADVPPKYEIILDDDQPVFDADFKIDPAERTALISLNAKKEILDSISSAELMEMDFTDPTTVELAAKHHGFKLPWGC